MTLKKKRSFLELHPEAKGLFLLAIALILFLSLFSFHPQLPQTNWLGLLGYGIAYGLTYLIGLSSFAFLFYLSYLGLKFLTQKPIENTRSKHVYFSLFVCAACLLLNLLAEIKAPFPDILTRKVIKETIILDLPYPQMHIRHNLGGVPFYYLYRDLPNVNLKHLFSNVGISITFSIIGFVCLLLCLEISALSFWRTLTKIKTAILQIAQYFRHINKEPATFSLSQESKEEEEEDTIDFKLPSPVLKALPVKKKEIPLSKREQAISAQRVVNGDFTHYKLPSLNLLNNPTKVDSSTLKKDLKRQAELLEETLLSFGIEAKVGEIHCGPTITSFEVHPSVGVKVQKIKALENDIALNLQAKSIRIIAPIPGKAAVGVEIPSLFPQAVSFKELLLNYQQKKQKLQIPILLGKTVNGELVMSDLAKMPHCIIAGATGSGKSVCINTIVMSIVMNASPDEIKLLMVDPKKVELTGYTNLPHMMAPVITEAHGAYAALNFLVKEMQTRYDILKQLGLRNISAFNTRKKDPQFEQSLDVPIPDTMYKIVAIIDEFADLMMASSSDLETPIARIAQMARAVGIHLILATQRPSREVITGLIKANFPTRIAFKVASRINSQIILDEPGAESLLGNGDLLFLAPGSSQLTRAQGSYISDEEINQITEFICNQSPPQYLIPSFDKMAKEDSFLGKEGENKDCLYEEAYDFVVENQTASTSFLQRKLKIGYARAASLIDELEEKGVIGSQEGAKARVVLVTSQEAAKAKAPKLKG